jgi:endonuclease/exonuclease/phosphatase (EEP) superfamily protein YafD
MAWTLARSPAAEDWVFVGAIAAAVAWQMSWIWRYLPGAPREVAKSEARRGAADGLAVLTTNVLQSNRDVDALLRVILDADPDMVLAVETDEWWCSELTASLGTRYPHVERHPLSTGYGLALLSRLELIDPEVRFVVDEAVPSIRTGVRLRAGSIIDLYCVHPRPPSLQQGSTERDLELVLVAREIKERGRPAILVGDLNDVAWSPSSLQFTRVGGMLDPRRGRGFYNTYPARLPGFRYPLDYVFSTPHFDVARMKVLRRFGSDHLPLLAELHLRSDAGKTGRV